MRYDRWKHYSEQQELLKEWYEKEAPERQYKHWTEYRTHKLICEHCGSEFYCRNYLAEYCSNRCRNDANVARRKQRKQVEREKICSICGIPFIAARRDAVFCSAKCRQKNYRELAQERFYLNRKKQQL